MRHLLSAIAVVALGFAGAATAQPSAGAHLGPPAPVALNLDYLKGYLSDTGTVIGSMVRWRPSGWLKMSVCMLAMARLADEEDDLQAWVQDHRTPGTDRIAGFAKCLGDGKYALPALSALYCYGRLLDSPRAQRTALVSLESLAVTGVFCGGIKLLSHKHRPVSCDLEDCRWNGPSLSASDLSFPSGHSAVAFAVATVISSEYGDSRLVPPLAYGAASLCALSRINDNAHWPSDVLVGSAIGYLAASTVVALHGDKSRMNLTILPAVHEKRADLSVSCRF